MILRPSYLHNGISYTGKMTSYIEGPWSYVFLALTHQSQMAWSLGHSQMILFTYNYSMSRVSCQKGPTRHAYAWQIGPFWQDTLDVIINPCLGPGKKISENFVMLPLCAKKLVTVGNLED